MVSPVRRGLPSIFRPDPRMATPYSQQASAGAEYLLAKNLTLRADYLFVHGVKLPRVHIIGKYRETLKGSSRPELIQ